MGLITVPRSLSLALALVYGKGGCLMRQMDFQKHKETFLAVMALMGNGRYLIKYGNISSGNE